MVIPNFKGCFFKNFNDYKYIILNFTKPSKTIVKSSNSVSSFSDCAQATPVHGG